MSTHVKERVSRFALKPSKVSAMPFGLTAGELVAALLATAFFVSAAIYYFTSLKPERERLKALEAALDSQQQVLRTSLASLGTEEKKVEADTPTDALNSLQVFKSQYLKQLNKGRIELIDEINGLAKKNNTQLTSGIQMSLQSVEPEDEEGATKKKNVKKKADFNAFPHLSIHFEVAGSYSSLRAFIAELERSRQFIVLDSVNLTSIESTAGEGGQNVAAGAGINLAINMTAYFQP